MFTLGKGVTSSYLQKVKSNTLGARQKRNCSQQTCSCPRCYGLCISFNCRDMRQSAWGCTKTISAPNYSSRMEKMLSGKKTKHIKAKFFLIQDRVDNEEIRVIDCPAEKMWADIMTKPLQRTAFRVMRAELMNCPVNYEDPTEEEAMETKRTQSLLCPQNGDLEE